VRSKVRGHGPDAVQWEENYRERSELRSKDRGHRPGAVQRTENDVSVVIDNDYTVFWHDAKSQQLNVLLTSSVWPTNQRPLLQSHDQFCIQIRGMYAVSKNVQKNNCSAVIGRSTDNDWLVRI